MNANEERIFMEKRLRRLVIIVSSSTKGANSLNFIKYNKVYYKTDLYGLLIFVNSWRVSKDFLKII